MGWKYPGEVKYGTAYSQNNVFFYVCWNDFYKKKCLSKVSYVCLSGWNWGRFMMRSRGRMCINTWEIYFPDSFQGIYFILFLRMCINTWETKWNKYLGKNVHKYGKRAWNISNFSVFVDFVVSLIDILLTSP